MGCNNCGEKSIQMSQNELNFDSFVSLFENPLNVEVTNLQVVFYKKWHIQVTVSYDKIVEDGTKERVSEIMILGAIN